MLAHEDLVGFHEGRIIRLPRLALLVQYVESRSIRLVGKLPAGHATCKLPHGLMHPIANLVLLPLSALHDRAADALLHQHCTIRHVVPTVVSLQDKEKRR